MNRRDLLKSIPAITALTPFSVKLLNKDGTLGDAQVHTLQPGPFYLFVLNPANCDADSLSEAFQGSEVKGGYVFAHDCDLDNFCRIYKFEE